MSNVEYLPDLDEPDDNAPHGSNTDDEMDADANDE